MTTRVFRIPAEVHAARLDSMKTMFNGIVEMITRRVGEPPKMLINEPTSITDEGRRRTFQLSAVWFLPERYEGKTILSNHGFHMILAYGHECTIKAKSWGSSQICTSEITVPEDQEGWVDLELIVRASLPRKMRSI